MLQGDETRYLLWRCLSIVGSPTGKWLFIPVSLCIWKIVLKLPEYENDATLGTQVSYYRQLVKCYKVVKPISSKDKLVIPLKFVPSAQMAFLSLDC